MQKVREHRSERNEIASSQLTDNGEFNKDRAVGAFTEYLLRSLDVHSD